MANIVAIFRTDFFLVLLGRVATALVAVASLRIMTSLLEPGDYGLWVLLIAFQSLCGLFLINPVDQHIFRQTHMWWDDGTLLRKFKLYNRYITAVSVFIAIVVAIWWGLGGTGHNEQVHGLTAGLFVGLLVYFGTWSSTLIFSLNMLGFRSESIAWTLISVLLGLILSSLLAFHQPHALSWVLGQICGHAVGALGAWRTLRAHSAAVTAPVRSMRFSDFLDFTTLRNFCFPLAAATGLMWAQNSGYRFWVGEKWGVAELGIMVIGLGVSAQLTAIVESLAMQFLYPYFARRVSDSDAPDNTNSALSDLMNVLAPVYAIWAGFNAVCATVLLHLLTDSRYHSAVPFVLFGAAIEFARCTTNLWSNTARAIRRTGGLILPYAVGAAVVAVGTVALNHLQADLTALAVLLVIAGLSTCITMMVQMQRALAISVKIPRLTFGMCVMCLGFVTACMAPIEAGSIVKDMVSLALAGGVTLCLMFSVLWRNPALTRLLNASLRVAPP